MWSDDEIEAFEAAHPEENHRIQGYADSWFDEPPETSDEADFRLTKELLYRVHLKDFPRCQQTQGKKCVCRETL